MDYRKWNGQNYAALSYTRVNSNFLGKIKPINPEQILGFDMLQDDSKTIKYWQEKPVAVKMLL